MNQIFYFVLVFAFILICVPTKAKEQKCEEKEKSLASLDTAEDVLNKAKALYPNCKEENVTSNSSECGLKDKSLGYIDVALNLVSDVKKNFPVCPSPPVVEEKVSRPMDCQEVMEAGHNKTGVYQVWPRSRVTDDRPVRIRCDMDTDGGGWNVIQRRGNFSVQEDFNRDWNDYKYGFGNLRRDYWIGNDRIYALSNQGAYSIRFDMMDVEGNTAYQLFRKFWIDDENSNYTLHINDSSGTAGDSMAYHNGHMFSTKDRDNDKWTGNCAVERKSGFWWKECSSCNPNGLYKPGVKIDDGSNMYYSKWKNLEGLYAMEIKLKRLD